MSVSHVPHGSVLDVIAQLEVITKDHGCFVDLTAIIDASVCPVIDLWLPKPHKWQSIDDADTIIVTPTESSTYDKRGYTPQPWCSSSDVPFDVLSLLDLGLLVKADLEVYLNLLNVIKATIDLDLEIGISLNLLGLLDLSIGGHKVNKCTKHFKPHCHKSFPANTPGCKTTTANNSNSCLAQCHAWAAGLNIAAHVQVGDVANIVDCTAISFNQGLTVDNCLMATVNVLGLLIDADIDALIRI